MRLGLGFQKLFHRLRGDGPGAGLSRKSRNYSAPHRSFPGGLQPLADKIGQDTAQGFVPLLCQMLRNTQNVFVQIDGCPHNLSLTPVMI
jgi:hypothetical protein